MGSQGSGHGYCETREESRWNVRTSLIDHDRINILCSFLHRFQWVYCQLEVLRHCFPTELRRTLEELPESLDKTYERILKGIHDVNRKHARRLLQCLTLAAQPLPVE